MEATSKEGGPLKTRKKLSLSRETLRHLEVVRFWPFVAGGNTDEAADNTETNCSARCNTEACVSEFCASNNCTTKACVLDARATTGCNPAVNC